MILFCLTTVRQRHAERKVINKAQFKKANKFLLRQSGGEKKSLEDTISDR